MTIYILPVFNKAVVFHRVGLLWIIETKEKYKFAVDEYFREWCRGGPYFNQIICKNLQVPIFEGLFVTASQCKYDLICGLHTHDKTIMSQLMKKNLAVEDP